MNLVDVHAVQAITLITAVIGLIICANLAVIHRRYWLYFFPLFIWLLMVAIFYNMVFLRDFGGMFTGLDFLALSAYLRLYGIAIGVGFLLGLRTRNLYITSRYAH